MKLEEVNKLTPMQRLIYWVRERHQVYLRRQAGKPKPWTDDPIIQSTYFTNPYRENDKVTVWLREQVREPFGERPEVLFAVIAFRWFNWIPTGRLLQGAGLLTNWDTTRAVEFLEKYKEDATRGNQVFTGAFNISNSGSSKPKIRRVCEDYIEPVWQDRARLNEFFTAPFAAGPDKAVSRTLEEGFTFLQRYPGLKGTGFMAAQIIADLKHTKWLAGARDWWTWCSPGPGSIRGLNILHGRNPESPALPNFGEHVANLAKDLWIALPRQPRLDAQDTQNCLCELSKYERVRTGGRSKRGYDGHP